MLQKLTAGVLVAFLMFAAASRSVAQDVKKDVKKETKPAVVNEVKKDVKKDPKKPTTPPTMKFASCSQAGCGFWVKSHSAKELRSIMKRHAKKYHKIELTDKQLKDIVKKEGAK